MITEEMKLKLFKKMLEFEHLGEKYDGYQDMVEGAFDMLKVLEIEHEYIEWAIGK